MRFYIQRLLTTAFITLALISATLAGENIMEITGGNVDAQDTITIQIKIQNEDDFTAFQSDIQLPDQLSYLENSALINTVRSQDHQLQVSLSDDDVLSVFGFSVNNNLFTGDTGSVASFKLVAGTIPGSYTLALQEAIIGGFDDEGNSVNILTSSQNGSVTLLAPEISLSTDSISFGEVPLETTEQRNLVIQNQGNEPLQIDSIVPDNSWFTTNQTYPLTISAGGSSSITVTFDSQVDDTYHNLLKIYSNDPDENQKNVILYVYAFAVNELHCGDINAFSGDTATLTFSVNNMEAFTGFQFDLQLPDELTYVENSEALTERKTDHAVNVSYINGNEIRAIAYSANNENFTGEDGDILSIDFYVDGTGGYYWLNMNEVIIADDLGENVLSDFYNGSLQIAAADISVSNSMDFGMVSILDTASQNLSVYNYGQDTLEVGNLVFSNNHFFTEHATSFEVLPGQSESIEVFFADGDEEVVNANLTINSNDPDESPKSVALSAETYIPNTMSIDSLYLDLNDTSYVSLNITNYEGFVGFQVDIDFPNNIAECYLDSIQLTGRADDHVLSSSMLDTNTVRIFAYSMSNAMFSGSEGPVIEIPFISDSITGEAPLELSENIIANEDSENILYFSENGFIEVNYQLHEIILSAGWNMASFAVEPEENNLQSILQPIIDNGELVKVIDEQGNIIEQMPWGWVNNIGAMSPTEGYYVKVTADNSITTTGAPVALPYDIPLTGGWNMMGYPSMTPQDATGALAGLMDNNILIKVIDEQGNIIENMPWGWVNNIGSFQPGEGYYIKITEDAVLTIEAPATRNGQLPESYKAPIANHFTPVYQGNPYEPMQMVIDASTLNLQQGDELAIFSDGKCVGAAGYNPSRTYQYLTASNDDSQTPEQDGYLEGTSIILKVYRKASGETNHVTYERLEGPTNYTSLATLLVEAKVLTTEIGYQQQQSLILYQNRPNPFTDKTEISYYLPQCGHAELSIYNMHGQKVATLVKRVQSYGEHRAIFNGNHLEPGLYVYKLSFEPGSNQEGRTAYHKMIIIK